jgi:FMN-dependent NADH-azoreductase
MKTLLSIQSSLFTEHGVSRQLSEEFIALWRRDNPRGRVVVRDLATDPIPHLSAERFAAFLGGDDLSAEQKQVLADSDAMIEELGQADEIVLGLPMYNLTLPSTLKAYFDHIARAGVTFRYTEAGSQGLLADRHEPRVARQQIPELRQRQHVQHEDHVLHEAAARKRRRDVPR